MLAGITPGSLPGLIVSTERQYSFLMAARREGISPMARPEALDLYHLIGSGAVTFGTAPVDSWAARKIPSAARTAMKKKKTNKDR
jgi:hypothetical protein